MKKTAFYEVHKSLGAKLVDFAGYEMPVQYSSMIQEHKAVRESVGLFDVSHMGEVFVEGEKALDFVQHITVNNAAKLVDGQVQYSAMCYEDGGIVDDLLVYKISDNKFMLVVNASNKDKDFAWMQKNNKFDVELRDESDDYSLLAVQGPNSQKVLQEVCDKELDLGYYYFFNAKVAGVDAIVSRTGYTGELGFEIYFKGGVKAAEAIWYALVESGADLNITPCGLGSRDSLRLEMGMCLYGNDIDQTTNTIEAGLKWITKLKKGDFIGREALVKVNEQGITRKLVGMVADKKAFPRHGYEIHADGKKIGDVTSGTVSPILEKPIAMGYVLAEYAEPGKNVNIMIRGKEVQVEVIKLPFIKK
ncbi:MAG: aminomethyltransferase [Melioribacteraceae bacterium]|nr:MAG: aminomethyltransferase [Melioribacteraceae bacterium]